MDATLYIHMYQYLSFEVMLKTLYTRQRLLLFSIIYCCDDFLMMTTSRMNQSYLSNDACVRSNSSFVF